MVYKTKGIIHKDVYANLSKEIEMHLMTRKDAIARKLGIPFGYNVACPLPIYVPINFHWERLPPWQQYMRRKVLDGEW